MGETSPAIVAVSDGYPSLQSPNVKTMVHVLMHDFNELGVAPLVVAPQKWVSLTRWRSPMSVPPEDDVYNGIRVLRPRFLSFSSRMLPVLGSTYRWTISSFVGAVGRAGHRIGLKPHLCYGHFLMTGGLGALTIAQRFNVPAAVALGEGTFEGYERHFGLDRVREILGKFVKIIAVSEQTWQRCVDRYRVTPSRIAVFPNAADHSQFYPRPRDEARRKLGLPLERPIVAFVGRFNDNKGPLRVLEAIRPRPNIGAVFLGHGPQRPTGPQVLAAREVPHDQVPQWMCAADVYVQPVFMEASSNTMKEAMSCGLPIVSSDIATNREFLDPSMAMLIDPHDIDSLRQAILHLVDDPNLRAQMGVRALEKARGFQARERARRILQWLELV